MKKTNFCLTFLLTVFMSMIGAKASAYVAYDISVENADGVTIYYKWNSDKTELAVSCREGMWTGSYCDTYTGNVVIPSSVTYDGKEYSVTSICSYAFNLCKSLTSVEIPNSVTSIGIGAFEDCSGLTSVEIPNSVTSIGDMAFYGCSGLTSVTIPNSVTSIGIYTFYGCSGLTSVEIPNSVTSIGQKAFYGCSGLTSVEIPNSVTSIGSGAFDGTAWFENQPDGVVYIDKWAYTYKGTMPSNSHIILKDGTVRIANGAFKGCSGLTSVEIPNSVTSIGENAFNDCSGLTSVEIPNSVTSISDGAFYDCSGLTSVEIPNSVTSIGYWAFSGCSGLTSVEIPNSVTSISYDTFYGCESLTSVEIPSSVTNIGKYAFGKCSGLTKIEVASDNTAYDSRNDCNAIIETGSNTLIAGCQNTIIPNSVTSISEGAFKGCSGLTSVEIPNSVTSIGDDAFSDCSGLTSVTIGSGVTTIGRFAFGGLTPLPMDSNIPFIFSGCTALTKLLCLATTPPKCAANAFEGIDKDNCTLIVPAGSIADYKAADEWKDFLLIEESTTGIHKTHIDNALPVRQYDASGSRIAAPQRGINIIKNSDGTTKKVLVK